MNDGSSLARKILGAIKIAVGEAPAALHEPYFIGNEWLYLKECLDSSFVSSVGKFVDLFESDLEKFTGAKYAVAVVNGTAALHIALKVAGVKAGDEVLVPALTFVATANAVSYCNAIQHFVDSESITLGIDAYKLRDYLNSHTEQKSKCCINKTSGRVVRAIVPMHVFGHPVDMDGLMRISHDFNIALVEDAAESLGSYYYGKHTGTLGLMGTLSFNGNKTITTGGGGAILTNDYELAKFAKHLTTTAKVPHAWEYRHDEIGYNYRLPNLNAALGCAQLEQIDKILIAKRDLFYRYQRAFSGLEGLQILSEPKGCKSNFWLQTLRIDPDKVGYQNEILEITNEAGFMTRPAWALMSELNQFKGCPRMDLSTARLLSSQLINIPSSPILATR
ncbi:LegC family aminotransferase [Polynucleobacter sp. JS-JIR-5-A7]|uniref:LegC family aminotransferase n=1 Tax=Polynucleobacter sp. JS-JIR-5-A7 TaxID=1758395 RepID=UPI001BFE147E|nr:LegC family aminotransferase [Polynucleobacter sp. JS-JIR-5-A7]QWE06935.1 LegC family aminotransferase [Polynucleobacter sp. JS-JIR-5-A7]